MSFERLRRAPRFLRFSAVGAAGFVVNAVAFYLAFYVLDLGRTGSWIAAFIPAVTFTWWGNRRLTFAEHASTTLRASAAEWGRFVLTNAFGALVNFLTYECLIAWAPWPLSHPLAALAAGVLAGLVFNFTLSRTLVFRAVK